MTATTVAWNSGVTGDWFAASNWTPAVVPTAGYSATIGSGTAIVSAGHGAVQGVSILLGGLATGEPVTLEADGAVFKGLGLPPNETDMVIQVSGGNPFLSPLNATFLVKGKTKYDGQILVEAQGGGLTIDAETNGTDKGQFVFDNTDQKAVMVVEQESVLTFTGDIITNRGLIEVEGGCDIEAGVVFNGKGLVALEDGGQMTISGTVGANQQISFADETGLVTLTNTRDFHGVLGFTSLGGARIDLAGLNVQSLSVELPALGSQTGYLDLYSEADQQGKRLARIAIQSIGPSLASLDFDLSAEDFTLGSDGNGGTMVTYAPQTGIHLQQSLATPIAASAGTIVTFASILQNAFGTSNPSFTQIALLPTERFENTSTDVGYWESSDITPTWYLNGTEITARTVITADQIGDVTLKVGNQIADPAQFEAIVTSATTGPDSETITYNAWSVDPRVTASVRNAGFTGLPTADSVVASAVAFNQIFGQIVNNNLCNWIADNVAAGAGASMPLPDANLDPTLNVEGGFWRIAYSSAEQVTPVSDWGTLLKPGDIVRMGWYKPETGAESGHSTTVLAIAAADGTMTVYDNIDDVTVDGQKKEYIGIHGDAAYWKATDPLYITIYRLDPDQQYLIEGTSLGEIIAGSVYNDLIHPGGGSDTITAGPGKDEIQDTTANLDGITVTDFTTGDRLDFTDLDPTLATTSFANGVLTVSDGTDSASLTLPGSTDQVFVITADGNGGSFVDRLDKVGISGNYPSGYALASTVGRLNIGATAVVGGSGVTTTAAHASIIFNAGTILAETTATGLTLNGGGILTNGSITNVGASIFGGTGVLVKGFGVVTNYGVIGSTTGGRALVFNSADSRLIEYASGQLIGSVRGGGGTLELARSPAAGTLEGLGTQITGFADIEIDTHATWSFAAGSSIATGTSLSNAGTLALLGQFVNSGEIKNELGATLDLQGDFGIGKVGRFFNDGTLIKSAGNGLSLVQAGGQLTSSGRIVVQSGTLELSGSLTNISGAITGAGTIAFGPGAGILSGHVAVRTAGLSVTGKNASLTVAQDTELQYEGTFSSGPGTKFSTGGASTSTSVAGRAVFWGDTTFDHSTVAGFGQLVTRGETAVQGVSLTEFARWDNIGALVETGTLAFVSTNASFINHAPATFTLQGKVDIQSESHANVFRNDGYLVKTGGSNSTISSALDNDGVVEVASGRLTITGVVSGRGTLQIDANQTLALEATVGAQQTVSFGSGSERLMLGDAVDFGGRLENFASGDKLDFTHFDPTTATVGFAENSKGTAGTLTITDGTHEAHIMMLGQYVASGFHVSADGNGGTLVTYTPPAESNPLLAAAHAG